MDGAPGPTIQVGVTINILLPSSHARWSQYMFSIPFSSISLHPGVNSILTHVISPIHLFTIELIVEIKRTKLLKCIWPDRDRAHYKKSIVLVQPILKKEILIIRLFVQCSLKSARFSPTIHLHWFTVTCSLRISSSLAHA